MEGNSGCLWAAMKYSTIAALAVLAFHWLTAGADEIVNPEPTVPTTHMENTP